MRAAAAPSVGEAPPAPELSAIPAGFAQIFPGWNVWQLWGSEEPNQGLSGTIFNTGLSLERQLRIWVENAIKDGAPGAAVADPANPAALRGDQIQLLPSAGTLKILQTRGEIPSLAAGQQLGAEGSRAIFYTVRFYNRGQADVLPWPHDENYLLENVYKPDPENPLTSGPRPDSLAGAASDIGEGLKSTLKVVAVVAGVGLGVVLLVSLLNSRKVAA